ncbi:unnamed protein product, partial [Adineta steineri]
VFIWKPSGPVIEIFAPRPNLASIPVARL